MHTIPCQSVSNTWCVGETVSRLAPIACDTHLWI